ncbi:hypothetical protein PMI01_00636 [Caulobacter sp. AP07]|uniref:hypothetical protein n=1 Tax=Caulobacter sp. AP07 TaxID=1144304 RepID=UPI000271ED58|nr:hypothetical protein [Caulobacter sp. AP07]EJL37558.1 hypothetical protein PMI01_00636 [Caulobacter sp. AP07]
MRRTKRPSREFVYWMYFIACVFGLGGLGVWVELIQTNGLPPAARDWNNTYTSLVTFFPALIASSCVQMVFEVKSKRMHAFSIVLILLALVVGLMLISHARPASAFAWTAAVAASLGSLWIWWIANADNPSLHDEASPEAAVGGALDAPLATGSANIKLKV